MLMAECDSDMNGTIVACEVFDCVVAAENAWRAEVCPEVEPLYCENPFLCAYCEGAWTCDDIKMISEEAYA
jgi:hypothetical protein